MDAISVAQTARGTHYTLFGGRQTGKLHRTLLWVAFEARTGNKVLLACAKGYAPRYAAYLYLQGLKVTLHEMGLLVTKQPLLLKGA